jgi:hypothetical protein
MHEFSDIVKGSTGEDVLILQTVLSRLYSLLANILTSRTLG